MQIQVNTDTNIDGNEKFAEYVRTVVTSALDRFSGQVTRVEVHLSDQNAHAHGAEDMRCMMEARLEGRQPTAVTHSAATVGDAVDGAAGKLARSIENTIGRLHHEHVKGPIPE